MAVLVLNASYEPLHVVSVRRAVVLLLKEKAQVVEAAESVLRAERMALQIPIVIRLVAYVHVPRRWRLPVSRKGVLARDTYTCQYCGKQPPRHALTVDHVVPRSRGGSTSWQNLVTACAPCNRRKGGRVPDEAGMRLLSEPAQPRFIAVAFLEARAPDKHREVWQKYVQPAAAF
jgi:5-methylcytosine-specific restriction endonuclease McrA